MTSLISVYAHRITRNLPNQTHADPNGNLNDINDNDNSITFLTFDLSTKKIDFGNGSRRVTTVAYEVKSYSTRAILITTIIVKCFVLDLISSSDSYIPFYSLWTDSAYRSYHCVINQMVQQNRVLERTSIVPIFDITESIMTSGLKSRLLVFPSVIA